MSEFPDYPYPLVAVPGAQLYREWQKLQAQWRKEGCSAVVLGDHDHVLVHEGYIEQDTRPVEEILAVANEMTGQDYFARRLTEWSTFMEDLKDGEWPQDEPASSPRDLEADLGDPSTPQCWIARVPTTISHEIPAWLRWGNYNACPSPEEHTAVLHYWNKKYGLEVFAMRDESVQYIVGRPPADRTATLALAREHVLYCGEGWEYIPYRGGFGPARAAGLMKSRNWYFWWD